MPMLESVARQKNIVIKHIIYDGGSTDGSVEKLLAWKNAHENVVFVSEKDEGQADALVKALKHVDTPYFGWLNADDYYLDGGLLKLLSEATNYYQRRGKLPAIIYGDYIRVDSLGKIIAYRPQPTFNRWDCLHGYITVQNAAAIFNCDLLRKAGGFDKKWRFVMDYDIILKLSGWGDVLHVPSYCGAFRHHAAAKTSTLDNVFQHEARLLRIQYGGSSHSAISKLTHVVSKVRVAIRMARQGCLFARF